MTKTTETEAFQFAKETLTFVLRDFLKKYKKNKLNFTKQNFVKAVNEEFKKETAALMFLTKALEIPGFKTLGKDIEIFAKEFGEHCYPAIDVSLQTLNDLCKEYDKANKEESHLRGVEKKQNVSIPNDNNVKIGQIWESMDKTRPTRRCLVKNIHEGKAILQEVNKDGDETEKRPSTVTISNMKPNSKGWILYQNI